MKRYSSYKSTGIQWLPEIPSHWEVLRFGSLFKRKPAINKPEEELLSVFLDRGVIKASDSDKRTHQASEDLSKYQLVEPSDFVMNNQQAWRGSVGVSDYTGIISPAYHIFPMPSCYDYHYANYLLRERVMVNLFDISSKGVGSIQRTLNFNWLNNGKCLLPPIEEQKKIVAFLDKQITLIESCKCQRERELQTLNELKQAEIASVVTRGLNPSVPMKDSGFTWIGMIPKHWNVKSLRAYLRLVSEKNHPDATLLSVTREQGVIVRDVESKEENHNFIPEDLSGYKYVRKGQFVINKMKAWQGSYGVSLYDGIVSPAYYVCDLDFPDKEYFSLAIRSKTYVDFFARWSKGIRVGQWDLEPIALKSVPFLEPPVKEMQEIVDYIRNKTQKIDTMIEALTAEIDRLTEYKQRLISDVVTGQINVQNEQV